MIKLRKEINEMNKSKITINDMLIKVAAMTWIKVPDSNSSWMGNFIRHYKDWDMWFAVQTPNGLIAPIIYKANLKGF